MNLNIMKWFDFNILIFMGISLALNALIAYLWHKKFYLKLGLKTYKAIQRIHLNETPRLGGLVFMISLISYVVYCHANENTLFLKLILLCFIPTFITALKEDLFHNVKPSIRLLSLLFTGWLFISQFSGPVPNLANMPFMAPLLNLNGGTKFFYVLCIVAIANGSNLIDGVNGLCVAVALSIFAALLFISYKTSDLQMLSTIFSVMLILLPFAVINYPYGKIFLGDLGAYSLGIIASTLTIILFGRHPEISVWGAVLILIYPVTEVVFSVFRRMINSDPIHHADKEHLHLKLFNFYRPLPGYKKIANALVTPTLSMLWLFPLISIAWNYHKKIFILTAIFLFISFYCLIYFAISKSKKT